MDEEDPNQFNADNQDMDDTELQNYEDYLMN